MTVEIDLRSSVVAICEDDGQIVGTGFVVSDDGLIVTCSHVVQSESSQRAGRPRPEAVAVVFHVDGSSHSATVVPEWWRSCDAEDVAFLRLNDALPSGVRPLKLGLAKISRGHEFLSHGYRLAEQFAHGLDAEGRIQSLTTYHDKSVLQLLTNQIDHGMSGAPILDMQTQHVVGMSNFFWETKQHVDGWLAGAVPAETLNAVCDTLLLHSPQAVEDYLAAVREYCANLPYLTLHDIRPPKTLDEVYVPLKARPQLRKDEDKPNDEQERVEREALRLQPLSIAEVMQSRDATHVLILGEPGAGKSTLLRQMAERAWDAPQTIGLSEPHLTLLVPLRQLAASDGSLEKRLSHALASEMSFAYDLPEGFLVQWPEQTNARWLIMLDALDEVPDSERARLMQWLKGQLTNLREHRVIITSRPTGYKDDFALQNFGRFDLLPFTPAQTSEFAHKWFKDNAGAFLKALVYIQAGDLRGTPLLLTIAGKVFSERNTLPERRADLYAEMVRLWLKEANQENRLNAELGEQLAAPVDQHIERLEHLALRMTEVPDATSLDQLQDFIAEHLHQKEDFPEGRACNFGRSYLEIMARRSGVFTHRDGAYQFIHPTFREYLAAQEVINRCGVDPKCVWQQVLFRWHEPNWRQVALFTLSLLSEKNQDVDQAVSLIVDRILHTGGEDGLLFAGEALAEQAKIPTQLVEQIIDGLLAIDDPKLVDILGRLHEQPRIVDGLMAVARTGKRGYFRAGSDIEH